VFIAGGFAGTIDFGGGPLTSVANTSDVSLAKFDSAGGHLWSKVFPGTAPSEYAWSVDVDGLGNAVITGELYGPVDFGGGAIPSQSHDIFLAKFSGVVPPVVNSIIDVANDQGRLVRINFDRAEHDSPGSTPTVVQYEAFRRIDAVPSLSVPLVSENQKKNGVSDALSQMVSEPRILLQNWEYVGAVPAHGEQTYNMIVPTLADSTNASGQHWSIFFIRAATSDPFTYFDSPPDSGYSLDNLSPAAPTGLALNTSGFLTWDEASEPDSDFFSVYGSSASGFDGNALLLGYTTGTSYDVTSEPYNSYHVTITDFAGNEGDAASISNTVVGIPDIPNQRVLSLRVDPNPFNPTTTITYSVPKAGPVTLVVYDVEGRLIDTLLHAATLQLGEHQLRWGANRSTGIYFVRLETPGGTRVVKAVLLK